MSGHSHWATIKHKKGAIDAKRGKLWSKLSRAIIIAARHGGGDPTMNLKLRYAIDKARQVSMPKDNIERAIKRGTGEVEGLTFEEITYEGYGPGGVAMLVVAQGSGGKVSLQDAALLLLTALSWAVGTIATKVVPMPQAPLAAAAAPLLAGSAVLAIVALASGEGSALSPSGISARSAFGLGYLVVMGTVVAFAAYVWLLRHVSPTRVATYAFINPAGAVLLGWAIAGESLTPGTLLATAVIVAAVAVAVTGGATSRRPRPATVDASPPSVRV